MKNKPEPDSDLILSLDEDGRTRLQVRLEGETVWLALNQMRDSAFAQSEAIPQVLSAAKNNMVALSSQIFSSTQIPACLRFFAKDKNTATKRGFRDRRHLTDAALPDA